jgi:glutathione synthase/RimK-type ligase-like ATP-grasp enzyme
MSDYFMYCDATSTTGKALLQALKDDNIKISGGSQKPTSKVGTLIRWGATAAPLANKPTKVINNAKSIGLASNKLESLKELKKHDVRVPELFTNLNDVHLEHFPVLGRKTHHIAGNDIILCLQKKDLAEAVHLGSTYFTRYIPTSIEYRVHVFGEDVIKVSQKVLTEPERNKDCWIRNFDEGYTFHQPSQKLSAQAKGMAVDAVSSLGLTFGAVDLVVGDDGKTYVLEVNTAPGLQTDNSIEVYVKKFKEALS